MDEMSKEYILQWSGHAASITERFSGLLARQAFVDVTLICQEQKLRVHKLVLASCSLYFEEMLEQDLGQEPIIVLKDLNFDILKAMVEFMYCGETTIRHCHLQSLLEAAQIFKVQDLEAIVHGMMSSKNYIENMCESIDNDDFVQTNGSIIGRNCVQVKLSEKDCSEKSSQLINELFDDTIIKSDNNIINNTSNDDNEKDNDNEIHEIIDSTNEFTIDELNSNTITHNHTIDNTIKDSRAIIDNNCRGREQNKYKIMESSMLLSKKMNENYDTNEYSDLFDIDNGVGECLRVYTHKKRNENGGNRKSTIFNNILSPETLTTDCIDLSNDGTCDIAPVTLTTNLDMVTNDYIWSLNTDSIRYVIGGCTMNQVNPIFNDRNRSIYEDKKNIRQIKELFSVDNGNITMKRPILRRSERLNQPEIDDNVQNNNETITREKIRFNNIKSFTKSRRKIKESDENSVESKKNVNNSRTMRSTTKYTSKSGSSNNNSTRCSYTKISKDEKTKSSGGKLKNINKLNNKIETIDSDNCIQVKLNTIASVDRALWGDMSDIMENSESGVSLPEHSSSKEIPFAVGLLPLHAALERMQAMPDYQPRKTRSSFAPVKHYQLLQQQQQQQQQDSSINGLKRKANCNDNDNINLSKRLNNFDCLINNNDNDDDNGNDTSNTFCHIEIHTSSQCSENRNSTDQLVSVQPTPDHKR
ncbi:hypothetical protein PV327_002074 [Microctonus hyperodae]|uniref:BTB domain-containing protein n=1 Tax=Microctonus hyperodae TaxID=165561 RepID=A0AA39KNQ3_MICHY|nr:hypothetical protein PV327_002074 [Microctonus hyperodae]